jgi:hypothetical protein
LINLLTKKGVYVELYSTISILGQCLLPFLFLALASLFSSLMHPAGFCLGVFTILWSTTAATRLFEYSLEMQDQKFLIAYPICLFYCVFVMLTIF